MERCVSTNELRCIYLTKENYKELLEEVYPEYKNDYIIVKITDKAIFVESFDMIHSSMEFRFGWWVEELSGYEYPKWNYYTDDEFKHQFQRKSEWSLCKDKLPSISDCHNYDDYTNEHYDAFWVTVLQNQHGLSYSTKMCYRPERNLWYRDGSDLKSVENVIAWMPLSWPEPYRISDSDLCIKDKI